MIKVNLVYNDSKRQNESSFNGMVSKITNRCCSLFCVYKIQFRDCLILKSFLNFFVIAK